MEGKCLTEEAENDRLQWEDYNDRYGCSCHLNPPCASCTHPGNPSNQEEDPTAWEDLPTEYERALGRINRKEQKQPVKNYIFTSGDTNALPFSKLDRRFLVEDPASKKDTVRRTYLDKKDVFGNRG